MPEQVELIDYLRILWKRRWLFLGVTIGCMLAALVVSLLLPKKYESSLQLKIGRVWQVNLDDPYRMAAVINSEPFLDEVRQKLGLSRTAYEMKKRDAVVAQAIVPPASTTSVNKDTFLVNVVTRGDTPKQAVDLARAVSDLVVQEQTARFKELLSVHLLYEKNLESQTQIMDNEIHNLDATLKRLQTNPQVSAPAVILLQAQLEQKQSQLLGFIKELRDVHASNTSATLTENTHVVLPPVLPRTPISPKIAFNVAIAGVIGVLAALMMVFFLEYLDRVQHKEKAAAS